MGPHPGEPREQVLELRQLDLELGLVTPGPGREDVEDDFRAVHDAHVELALEVGALDGTELLIENDQGGIGRLYRGGHFFHLALADECGWIGSGDLLGDPPDHLGPGGVDQPGQLLEVFGDVVGIGRALPRSGHQHRALDRITNLNQCSNGDSSPPGVIDRLEWGSVRPAG